MKRYSFKTRELREADNEIVRFNEEIDVLITSEEFNNAFRGYIEDIARFKKAGGRKFMRPTDYPAVGIMDMNDLYQEAYLAFFEAYKNYKESVDNFEDGAAIWSYLKKSTILNFEKSIRANKDGVRVPERVYFDGSKEIKNNLDLITSLFGHLERVFSNNAVEVATTK